MKRRRFLTLAGGALAAGAVGAAGVAGAFSSDDPVERNAPDDAGDTRLPTATIIRGDLGTSREFRATISFGDPWVVNTAAAGTITWALPAGTVVDFGEALIKVDDKPLHLAAGTVPLFRELYRVDTRGKDVNGDRLTLQEGFDVAQLQAFLLASGHLGDVPLEADARFGKQTETAVKAWQRAVGHSPTGRRYRWLAMRISRPRGISTAANIQMSSTVDPGVCEAPVSTTVASKSIAASAAPASTGANSSRNERFSRRRYSDRAARTMTTVGA